MGVDVDKWRVFGVRNNVKAGSQAHLGMSERNDFIVRTVERVGPQQRRGTAWRFRTTTAKISL